MGVFSNGCFLTIALVALSLFQFVLGDNDRPVIGIFAQPYYGDKAPPGSQYIAASYVKWIESAGGRVVPLNYDISKEDAERIVPQLNGILWPGGGAEFGQRQSFVMDLVVKLNEQGIHLPMWGTCMGFQFLSIFFSKNPNLLFRTNSYNISYPLIYTPEAYESKFLTGLGSQIANWMEDRTKNVTLNNHNWSVSIPDFEKYMQSELRLISTNYDEDGKEFVSTWEHRKFPIYGVQWHPEKNNFEYARDSRTGLPYERIVHSPEGVRVSQALANFFVDEARKNNNRFVDWRQEQRMLIKNHQVSISGPSFEQSYFFQSFITE